MLVALDEHFVRPAELGQGVFVAEEPRACSVERAGAVKHGDIRYGLGIADESFSPLDELIQPCHPLVDGRIDRLHVPVRRSGHRSARPVYIRRVWVLLMIPDTGCSIPPDGIFPHIID